MSATFITAILGTATVALNVLLLLVGLKTKNEVLTAILDLDKRFVTRREYEAKHPPSVVSLSHAHPHRG